MKGHSDTEGQKGKGEYCKGRPALVFGTWSLILYLLPFALNLFSSLLQCRIAAFDPRVEPLLR
jgi:hypothetical protein